MRWRYFATVLKGDGTETPVDQDIPLGDVSFTEELSGAGVLTGTLAPETGRFYLGFKDELPLLRPWLNAVYAEADGQIRFGGILADISDEGPKLVLDVVGFTAYANDQPYDGEWSKVNIDPLDAAREIWAHLQSKPQGNIGLKVDGLKSPVRIGTETKETTSTFTSGSGSSTSVNGNTGEVTVRPGTQTSGSKTTITPIPYDLVWWKTNNLGNEFNKLAKETPFDYRVEHTWVGDTINHALKFGYPTLSAVRNDLRFVAGENVFAVPKLEYDGDEYASEVMVLGTGEGRKMIRSVSKAPAPGRLRRILAVSDPGANNAATAKSRADRELKLRTGDVDVTEILVIDHPHAPLGSYGVGDVIQVGTTEGWSQVLNLSSRILSITTEPERGISRLKLLRTDRAGV
jgi:hypothetical protein